MDETVLSYRAIIKKDGKYYHGSVPSLPGCHTQGKTIDETKKNLREAIVGCLTTLTKHKQPIPTEEGMEVIETFNLSKIFPNLKTSPPV